MQNKSKIIITGASGLLGSALVNYFAEKYQVVAFVRKKPTNLTPGVEYSVFKLNEQIDETTFIGVTHFIHCAYIKTDQDENALQQNIDGTKRIVDLCRTHAINKLIFLSSMSAKSTAVSIYGQQKFQCEQLFSGDNDLIIRPGLIIGNGGLMASIIDRIKKNKFIPLIDGGKQKLQTIYIDDLTAAIDTCITNNISGTLTLAEPIPVTLKEFCNYICITLKLKRIFIPIPYWFVYTALSLLNTIVKFPINKDNLIGLKSSSVTDITADLKKIGINIGDYRSSLQKNFSASSRLI